MTETEYNSLSSQDQSVFQIGYSLDDCETLFTTPVMSYDSDDVPYHYCDETFFYDHYTGTYWTQVWKEDPIGPLVFGPSLPSL